MIWKGSQELRFALGWTKADAGTFFTFDAHGNIINIQDVGGFPIDKLEYSTHPIKDAKAQPHWPRSILDGSRLDRLQIAHPRATAGSREEHGRHKDES
jgi:hypothetical protein